MHDAQLAGQVAIVTGATAGIGMATARALAKRGMRVVAVARARDRIEQLLGELETDGGSVPLGISCDVRSAPDVDRMVDEVLAACGRIDVLVASAGVLRPQGAGLKTLVHTSLAEWDEVVDTNLRGLFLTDRAILRVMLRQRAGHVINVSSTSGRKAYAFDAAYCASKFGAIGLTETIAEEARPHGIRVQLVLPGPIDTPMWDQNGPLRRPEYAVPVERVANLILRMLTLPNDTVWVAPAIDPLRRPERMGWLGQPRSGASAESEKRG